MISILIYQSVRTRLSITRKNLTSTASSFMTLPRLATSTFVLGVAPSSLTQKGIAGMTSSSASALRTLTTIPMSLLDTYPVSGTVPNNSFKPKPLRGSA